jgi:hypothetical protein
MRGVRKGDMVLQVGVGSGIKCGVNVWKVGYGWGAATDRGTTPSASSQIAEAFLLLVR